MTVRAIEIAGLSLLGVRMLGRVACDSRICLFELGFTDRSVFARMLGRAARDNWICLLELGFAQVGALRRVDIFDRTSWYYCCRLWLFFYQFVFTQNVVLRLFGDLIVAG